MNQTSEVLHENFEQGRLSPIRPVWRPSSEKEFPASKLDPAEVKAADRAPKPKIGSTEPRHFRGLAVGRPPGDLYPHPTLVRLNLTDSMIELVESCRENPRDVTGQVQITTEGAILSGFRIWQDAIRDASPIVDCIEYSLTDEEAIQLVLARHQPQPGWNDYNRIQLALELESHFQAKALANQTAGGKYKGWANLPKAEQIDVRQEIAAVARVGCRNVSKVKTIIDKGHPRIKEALQTGVLSINRATQWCAMPWSTQVEEFTKYNVERATNKVIRRSLDRDTDQLTSVGTVAVLEKLKRLEMQTPGSVIIRQRSRPNQMVVAIGKDLFKADDSTWGSDLL